MSWTIQEKHFDFTLTQPYFVYYLLLNNFKLGDAVKSYEYSIWIEQKHTQFKVGEGQKWAGRFGIGMSEFYQADFLKWLKNQTGKKFEQLELTL